MTTSHEPLGAAARQLRAHIVVAAVLVAGLTALVVAFLHKQIVGHKITLVPALLAAVAAALAAGLGAARLTCTRRVVVLADLVWLTLQVASLVGFVIVVWAA